MGEDELKREENTEKTLKKATGHNLFCDETVPTFFRRLCFSPDGSLLLTPTGNLQMEKENMDSPKESLHTVHVFHRDNLKAPVFYFPFEHATCAVQFSPVIYKNREGRKSWTTLPYRMVFAVGSLKRVALFDTQSQYPFSVIENLHYAPITDLAWSSDGETLIISSQDGYCSIVKFQKDQLGEKLSKDEYNKHFERVIAARKASVEIEAREVSTPCKGKESKEVKAPVHIQQRKSPKRQKNDGGSSSVDAPKPTSQPIDNAEGLKKNGESETTSKVIKPRKITPITVEASRSNQETTDLNSENQKNARKITPMMVESSENKDESRRIVPTVVTSVDSQGKREEPAPMENDKNESSHAAKPRRITPLVVADSASTDKKEEAKDHT